MRITGERFIPNSGFFGPETEIRHLQRYYSVLNLVKENVVLDIACGEGYGSDLIANHAKFVYGIDIDQETVEHASNKYKRDNLQFKNASVVKIPLKDHSLDVVVSFETIEHVNEHEQHLFLKEVKRLLKNDGIFIISTPDKRMYSDIPNYKNPFHVKEFYEDEFLNFLKTYFSYVDLYYQKNQMTYILSNYKNTNFTSLPINTDSEQNGRYLIAVCSNNKVKHNLNSIVI
ncbi:putative glycosyltransferase [Bacillus methanolicus PB1]|uniref:Putative glycosyltransferase n=1 Tax=Bacillus methanolicus PB1 TaxID=997296 RepID=I3E4B1_BACMT|nr:class I SAM-dependent methyltransferase [Bacillus methanolicus]EIJ81332.1 putative glycosyltransferase [Bacillus methanolicus PB1]